MDWQAHYAAIYSKMGVAATLDLGTAGEFSLTVIDRTAGVVVEHGSSQQRHNIGVSSIKPACAVRTHELDSKSIARTALRRASIEFNGGTWRVESYLERPSPSGLATGELMLILTEASDA